MPEPENQSPAETLVVEVIYRSCVNCGRIMSLQKDSKQVYCSPECSTEFGACPVCGRYFDPAQGHAGVCSPDCSEKHPEYDHLWKEQE